MKHDGVGDTNCNWCAQNNPKRVGKGTGRLGNQRTSGDHPYYSQVWYYSHITKVSWNTEKSPGDLRRLAVTQTPVRKHRLTLV